MAFSYFRFATPGVTPNPVINPLSYVQFSGTPPFTTGGPNVAFIWASVQIFAGSPLPRPILTGVLQAEINTAIATLTSTPNVYVKP
ncbi:hypothetical protein SAMN05518672_10112 [Chitinophaga sp. CF118]|uniref:hypothetical protein n=1 Tax=Chitinophaga sp. CF118 TaxID=1884367 RepID=UPI0008EE5209|nr:hypothetical protein [Chitinophaga sp. CF118]SFD00717.1 hypothetical protein SAMN05518672_10112 [Chitinophaga sp. CF118]